MSISGRDVRWDQKLIVVRDLTDDSLWDGKIKNQVYNPDTLSWEAQTGSTTSGTTTTSAPKTTLIDQASSSVIYVGKADIGASNASAVWQIKKVVTSGAVTSILWADGNSNFDNVWNNRASLSYS